MDDRSLPQRPLRRSPLGLLDGVVFTELGDALCIETATWRVSWARRYPLVWCPHRRALIVLELPKGRTERVGRDDVPADARRAFQRWTGHDVTWRRRTDIPTRGSWSSLGRATKVDYRSDREGPMTEYTHDTKAMAYRFGTRRNTYLWVLRGGGLNVTTRGIVG